MVNPGAQRYKALWQRPGQPYFAAAAGMALYLAQAELGMVRVAVNMGGAQAAESPGGMPLPREFYRTRVAPARVVELAVRYLRILPYLSWRTRTFGHHPSSDDLELMLLLLHDLQAWLDGETPTISRFVAARSSMMVLSGRLRRCVRLPRDWGEWPIFAYRTESTGRGLEVEDYVGADWCDCIPEDPTTRARREFQEEENRLRAGLM